MAFNHTLSAVLRGQWLIDKQWADAHFPMVLSFIKGEPFNFGLTKEDISPKLASRLAGAGINVYNVTPATEVNTLPGNSIAMVTLSGPMLKYGDYCSYGMVDQAQLIKQLGNCSNITGIIINIDSPGGQVNGTALLADVIKNVSINKPVVSFIDDGMAASAAMWIASASNEIYVSQSTDQVGSIGVYTKIADWNSYYKEALKLNVQDVYAPQSTDKNKDYRDAIAGDPTGIKEDLFVLANKFINTINENRTGKIKGHSWATGKMFYAKDAEKIGLIDGIKTFDQVIARIDVLIKQKRNGGSNVSNGKSSELHKNAMTNNGSKVASYANPTLAENAWFDNLTKYR